MALSESSQSVRDANLYFGQTASIYCVPNEFDYKPDAIIFNFDVWASVESFEAGDDCISRLRQSFEIKGDELATAKAENAQMFAAIENVALDLLRVGGRGYSIDRIFLSAIGKFMLLSATSPDNQHRPDDKFYGARHDAIILENNQTIAQATAFMIVWAKTHDAFINQMTVSESAAKLIG